MVVDVSVVIPAFNAVTTIRRAVDSALAQRGISHEVIVVDDGSTDGTRELLQCAGYRERIRLIFHDRNRGGGSARNSGASVARGRWIAFLDADDVWLPSRLLVSMARLGESKAAFAVGAFHWASGDGATVQPRLPPDIGLTRLLSTPVLGAGSTLIVSSAAFQESGGFASELPRHQDWDLVVRLASQNAGVVVREDLVELHRTGRPAYRTVVDAKARFLGNHAALLETLTRRQQRRVLAEHHVDLARFAAYDGSRWRVARHLAIASRLAPVNTSRSTWKAIRRSEAHVVSPPKPRILLVGPARPGEGGMAEVASMMQRSLGEYDVVRVQSRGGGRWLGDIAGFVRGLVAVFVGCVGTRPTILHLNVAPRGSLFRKSCFAIVARCCGRPYVVHLHSGRFGAWVQAAPTSVHRVVRAFCSNAVAVWVVADVFADELSSTLGVDRSAFTVVPNGVQGSTTRRLAAADPPKLLYIGRFELVKGVDVLLEALEDPVLFGSSWRATMLGGGAWPVEKEAARRSLDSRLTVAAWVDRHTVDRALAEASVLVVPSRSEGLPLVILEAFSAGTPVVAADVGAVGQLLEGGKLGFLVPPENPRELAAAIRAVLDDPSKADRRAARAKSAWQSKWTAEAFAARITEAYDEIWSEHLASS